MSRSVAIAICNSAFIVGLAITVVGCSNPIKNSRSITIASTPSGAHVLASGVEIGVTPLTIVPDEVFAPQFVGFSYRAVGTLNIKKNGCETFSEQVNDAVLSKDINVKLVCDSRARTLPAKTSTPHPAPSTSIEQRLRRLQQLHDQGLISDDEYRSIRKRILSAL